MCVCVGDISAEIKTEADSNDINDCSHDDMPNTGLFAVSLLAYSVYCICFLLYLSTHVCLLRITSAFK